MTPQNVYCDNETLRKIIQINQPIIDGLYAHEVVMLNNVSRGRYNTVSPNFAGLWDYYWHVKHPMLLIRSLVARGYVEECTDDDFLGHCGTLELRQLLKTKGIKHGPTKIEIKNAAKENVSGAEAVAVLGFRYFVLSEKGKNILASFPKGYADQNPSSDIAKTWKLPDNGDIAVYSIGHDVKRRLLEDGIDPREVLTFDFEIVEPSFKGNLYLILQGSRQKVDMDTFHYIFQFPQPVDVNVCFREWRIQLKDVSYLFILSNLKRLIFGTQAIDDRVDCTCFDLFTKKILFKERIPRDLLKYPTAPEYNKTPERLFPDSIDGIINDGCVNYYISPLDDLSELLINAHFATLYTVRKLPPIVETDISSNYCIAVPEEDVEARRLIMFLILDKKFGEPRMFGERVYDILYNMALESESKTVQTIMKNAAMENRNVYQAASSVRKAFAGNPPRFYNELREIYPNRALQSRPFGGYAPKGNIPRDENFTYAYLHQEDYRKKYTKLLLSLREKGIIKSRWISEFSLYLLVKSYFPDAEFQYRVEWLGQQSLDVYIPSLSLAIEYQGVQHSIPVEHFGGEEQFQETVKRDKRKKELCAEHNVRLLYWNYDEPIDDDVLLMKMQTIDIELPASKLFAELS